MAKKLLSALNDIRRSNPFLREYIRKGYHSNFLQSSKSFQWVYRKTINNAIARGLPFPSVFSIEVTNRCNASCVMCPRESLTRPSGIMTDSLFQKIIDEMVEKRADSVVLTGLGEPLIDKNLEGKIKYAKKRGIKSIQLFTNASLLHDKRTEDIINSGLDNLIISIDAVEEELYKKIRRNLSFEVVDRNIKSILKIREKIGVKKPQVKLNMTVLDQNICQRNYLYERYKDFVDGMHFTYGRSWGKTGLEDLKFKLTGSQYMANTRIYPCPLLWFHFNIFWDGGVAMCCMDFDRRYNLGELTEMSIEKIWHGDVIEKVRAGHLLGKFDENEICRDCAYNISWFNALSILRGEMFII